MDPTTKEHIKYQFCNVYNDLLSDLKNLSNVKPDTTKDSDLNEISLAPSPEKKKAVAPTAYKTRGRSRQNKSEDIFSELKASRQKKKQHSENQDDITANFNSSHNLVDDDGRLRVVADIHHDASQPLPVASPKRSGQTTIDEMFDTLLNKKSKETEINYSQDSDKDLFQVSKKLRRSYPGASCSKNKSVGKKQPSREKLNSVDRLEMFNFESDDDVAKKRSSKTSSFKTNKSFPPLAECINTAVDDLESDKLRSSPGWSRIRKLEEDFKDSSYKKPLNISINKSRLSLSKNSCSFTPNSKVENTSNLNISTSDSDQSDVRYFDSPDAVKRCQLMKHVVETYEKNDLNVAVETSLDPSMERLATNLMRGRKQYVKKLIESTKPSNAESNRKNLSEDSDNESCIEDPKGVEKRKNVSPDTEAQISRRRRKQIVETTPSKSSITVPETNVELYDVDMTDNTKGLYLSQNNSVQFIAELDNVQTIEGNTSNERLGSYKNVVGISPNKISALEHSSNYVSEKPLSTIAKPGRIDVTRKKLNSQSKELDNLLTQVVVTSSTESPVPKATSYDLTPVLTTNPTYCSRCRRSISNSELSQDGVSNIRQASSPERKEKKSIQGEELATERKDACIQTDDVQVSAVRSMQEISVQTIPTALTLETVSGKDKSDENAVRAKDEFILQTLKALMIQASHKLTINDLYNLGFEQENEPPRKKLKEITANKNFTRSDDETIKNENILHQNWLPTINRVVSNENAPHPQTELKTPQNQLIKRKTSSDMKYSFVSTPSSSERKLIDDSKFLNRSTVCPKDVTICENENVNPAEDSITKDVVPMEVEDESPVKIEPQRYNFDDFGVVQCPGEIDCNNLSVVRIRDRFDSSNSNDSMILSARKSSSRSLNFQNSFSKVDNDAISSVGVENSRLPDDSRNLNQKIDSQIEEGKSLCKPSASEGNVATSNQVDESEFSEDIRKSLSVLENMDTPKEESDRQIGIVENSDDESIIQATPKKNKLLNEMTLTPDMLSSQTSPVKKEENRQSSHRPGTAVESDDLRLREEDSELRPAQTDSDSSLAQQPSSNIDSQVNEIPSSIVPSCDDYLSKRLERKNRNNLCIITDLNPVSEQTPRSSQTDKVRSKPVEEANPMSHNIERTEVPENGFSSAAKPRDTYEYQKPKRLFIATSALPKSFMLSTQDFCKQFNCVYESEITERTTHLVVRTNNNKAFSTMKFILAVAMHKLIVTVDWIAACSKANKLLPEDSFIPLSASGRPGPLNSLLDQDTASSSPLFKSFIIHVVPPFSNCTQENFIDMLIQCGAKIAENYVDLAADKSRIRLILVNAEGAEEKSSFYSGLLYRYKAFILVHDWAIESISNYQVEPFCNHNPLNVVYGHQMVGYFQIPPYIVDQASQFFESNEDSYDDTVSELSTLPQ